MIGIRERGNFGRFGQLVNFLLLWGGLNLVLANWVLSDLLGAPTPLLLATIVVNFWVSLFSEILYLKIPGKPIPAPTLAEGTTTNRNRSAVRYHSTLD